MKADALQVARAAFSRPVVDAKLTARTVIPYDPYLSGRVVERVAGFAELGDGYREPWTAIVKQTRGPGLRAARRELGAYRAGIADAEGTGLRAPRLLGWVDDADQVELWLEDVRDRYQGVWPLEQFGLAARHIAAWDARSASMSVPRDFDSEDAWAERHGQPERVEDGLVEIGVLARAPGAAVVASQLHDTGFERTRAMIVSTASRIALLATYPQTLLHHDLVRSNLFAVDDSITLAIDWENVGRGPLGVDLAPLVVGSVRRGEASSDELGQIESLVISGYIDALRRAGVRPEHDVERAYRLAVGLRWHVVLGTISTALQTRSAGFRGSRPGESRTEALRHLLALSRHILEVAESE